MQMSRLVKGCVSRIKFPCQPNLPTLFFSHLRVPTKVASLGIPIFYYSVILRFFDIEWQIQKSKDNRLNINNRLSINDDRSPIDCFIFNRYVNKII